MALVRSTWYIVVVQVEVLGDAGEKIEIREDILYYVSSSNFVVFEILFDKNTRSKHIALPLSYSKWKSNMLPVSIIHLFIFIF